MNRQKRQAVKAITLGVRAWAEEYAVKNKFNDDLCGLCAIAAAKLAEELRANGFDAVIGLSSIGCFTYHAFVILDNHIIDITASQFGHDRIMITPLKEGRRLRHWKVYKMFSSTTDFIRHLEGISWAPEQMPLEVA